jgi:hypothetical protein
VPLDLTASRRRAAPLPPPSSPQVAEKKAAKPRAEKKEKPAKKEKVGRRRGAGRAPASLQLCMGAGCKRSACSPTRMGANGRGPRLPGLVPLHPVAQLPSAAPDLTP